MAEMTHAYIEAHGITSRYATGRLTADEEREFEAHLLDCPKCLEDVECETGLREGLQTVADESPFGRRAKRRRTTALRASVVSPFLAAAAALLLVTSIGLAIALSRSSAALQSARGDRDAQAGRAAQAEQTAAAARRQLADSQPRAGNATPPPAAAVAPASIFALTAVRDGSSAAAPPINQIALSADAGLVVFSLDLPNPGESARYTVTLNGRTGGLLWTGGPYRASSPDVLSVAVDSKVLPAGDYTLEVRQQDGAGQPSLIGRYPLRVIAR